MNKQCLGGGLEFTRYIKNIVILYCDENDFFWKNSHQFLLIYLILVCEILP